MLEEVPHCESGDQSVASQPLWSEMREECGASNSQASDKSHGTDVNRKNDGVRASISERHNSRVHEMHREPQQKKWGEVKAV